MTSTEQGKGPLWHSTAVSSYWLYEVMPMYPTLCIPCVRGNVVSSRHPAVVSISFQLLIKRLLAVDNSTRKFLRGLIVVDLQQ